MKKYIPHLISIPIILLALIPPIDFKIPAPTNNWWSYFILIVSFFGLSILFIKTNWFIKSIAVFAFLNCFLSSCPTFSFNAYVSIVGCLWFYILCTKIEDWGFVSKVLWTILLLNVFLMVMQAFGKDTLLNFGRDEVEGFGVVGQHMQMGSFSVILAAMLLPCGAAVLLFPIMTAFFCTSAWSIFACLIGGFIYFFPKNKEGSIQLLILGLLCFVIYADVTGKFANFGANQRWDVWAKTIVLANKHPFTGWGGGMFQHIFPALSGMTCIPWKTAHNFWVQLLFEWGYPGLFLVVGGQIWLFVRLWGRWAVLAAYCMILTDMMVHFPDRVLNCVPIMILFLAYCEYVIEKP